MEPKKIIIPAIICIQLFMANINQCNAQNWFINLFSSKPDNTPTTKIYGDREIEKGETATIHWKIEGAEMINIEGVKKNVNHYDSIKVTPRESKLYKFVIYRNGEETRKYYKIDVFQPKITYFNVPNERITDEEKVEISWGVKNANYISIPGVADSLDNYGRMELYIHKPVLKIIAKSKLNTTSLERRVRLDYVEYLKGSNIVYKGNKGKLYWKFKRADSVKIRGIDNCFAAKDTLYIKPKESKKYFVDIYKNNGDIETTEFYVNSLTPEIHHFDAPIEVAKNQETTIEWECRGVNIAWLNGVPVPPVGKKKAIIKEDSSFTLTINACNKTISEKLDVKLIDKRKYILNIDTDKTHHPKGLDFDIVSIDRSGYPKKIKMQVVVVDTFGNFVSNLAPPYSSERHAKKYFKKVTEKVNGNIYPLDFTVREVRIDTSGWYDISMVLDHSGSMCGKIYELQKAAREFISNKYSKDRINVIKFDHFIKNSTGLTKSKKSIIASSNFQGLQDFGGATALYAATDEGILNIKDARKNKVVIIFTDGYENSSFYYFGMRAFKPRQIADKVRKLNIKLFIISYGRAVNKPILDKLAWLSGGKHYNIKQNQDINKVFKELPRLLRYHYEITFTPHQIEGEHQYNLTFSNKKGPDIEKGQKVHIGENYRFDENFMIPVEMRTDLPVNINIITNPQVIARFGFDKHNLKTVYYPILERYVEYLKKYSGSRIFLSGHTDSKGTAKYCKNLSDLRAREIKEYMVKKGISSSRITTKGYGKHLPVWDPDNTPEKAYENRRVEAVLFEPRLENHAQNIH